MNNYQIILIEPGNKTYSPGFRKALDLRVKDLGLNPPTTLTYLDENTISNKNSKFPLVGVYFGSTTFTPSTDEAVKQLLDEDAAFILPIVTDLNQFNKCVPEALFPINGAALDAQNPNYDHLTSRVLEALRLIRAQRKVFISYLRREARGVAYQLYGAMQDRGFNVFLDTHTIAAGQRFQLELWDHMNDSDLVLLLETPSARTSIWVADEIAKALLMGVGIYQVIWPGVSREMETDSCEPYNLTLKDFDTTGNASKDLSSRRLLKKTVDDILSKLEEYRARSFKARRTRIMDALKLSFGMAGLSIDLLQPDRVEFENSQGSRYTILPTIGHMKSQQIHNQTKESSPTLAKYTCLLYDDSGIREERKEHLDWLNAQLQDSVQNLALKDAHKWLKQVK